MATSVAEPIPAQAAPAGVRRPVGDYSAGCRRCGDPRARSASDHHCGLAAALGVRDLERHQGAVIARWAARHGAALDFHDFEDLHAYLVILGWRLAGVYDPAEGISFSRYLTQTSEKRIVDWYRRRKVSRRLKHVETAGRDDCVRCGAPRAEWEATPCVVSFDALDERTPDRRAFEDEVLSRLVAAA